MPPGKFALLMMYVKPCASASARSVPAGTAGMPGLNGVLRVMRPPAPRPFGAAALEQPLDAEIELVGQRDRCDRDFDRHLPRRHVELLERGFDHRVFRRGGDDEQRVVVLVGDDLDVAHDADSFGGARDRLRHRARSAWSCTWTVGVAGVVVALRLERRRRDDRSGRRARRERRAPTARPRAAARPVNACVSSGPSFSAR